MADQCAAGSPTMLGCSRLAGCRKRIKQLEDQVQALQRKEKETAKEVLDQIDTFLAEAETEEAKKLWYILSALRGPDSANEGLKSETTAWIRFWAFPKAEQKLRKLLTIASYTQGPPFVAGHPGQDHFTGHVCMAYDVLEEMGLVFGTEGDEE